jgi:hypothetical protein
MTRSIEEQIAAVKARKDKASARLTVLQGKAKKEERKRDTRRKIIVGGMVIAAMEKSPALAARIGELLDGQVTRPHDREVIADLLGEGQKP